MPDWQNFQLPFGIEVKDILLPLIIGLAGRAYSHLEKKHKKSFTAVIFSELWALFKIAFVNLFLVSFGGVTLMAICFYLGSGFLGRGFELAAYLKAIQFTAFVSILGFIGLILARLIEVAWDGRIKPWLRKISK